MSNPEQVAMEGQSERKLDTKQCQPVVELVEIEPEALAQVAGGPDGSAIGVS